MANCKAQVRLVLIVLMLIPLIYMTWGLIADFLPRQGSVIPGAAYGGNVLDLADRLASEPIARATQPQRVYTIILRCFFLPFVLMTQKTLWRKPRIAFEYHHKQKCFAVEGKTSHPQLAPPVLFHC
jgi:hypothetical protein